MYPSRYRVLFWFIGQLRGERRGWRVRKVRKMIPVKVRNSVDLPSDIVVEAIGGGGEYKAISNPTGCFNAIGRKEKRKEEKKKGRKQIERPIPVWS